MRGRAWLIVNQSPVSAHAYSMFLVSGTAEMFICGPEQSTVQYYSGKYVSSLVFVVFFLWGDTPVSEFYMPTFRSTLSVPSL
jgi:hypothetical protein